MLKFSIFNVLFLLSITTVPNFAQTNTAAPAPSPNEEIVSAKNNRSERFSRVRGSGEAQSIFTKRGTLAFKKRLSRSQKKILEPSASDFSQYADFLQNPKTGVIRLFPDLGCEDNANVVRADETCLNQIPMSAFYSFREKEHTTDFLSDLRLKNGYLISDAILTQSILVELGDLPIENVSMNSGGMKFLNEFKPDENSEEALKQTVNLIKGIEADGFLYRKVLPAREDTTYALRVIAYRASIFRWVRGLPFDMLEGDDRIDLTVAFRLLKKDAANSNHTIVWRELSRQRAPKIVFPKRNKNSNYRRLK